MSDRIVIIGGGISGLAAAHRVLELNPAAQVTILEASNRLGTRVSLTSSAMRWFKQATLVVAIMFLGRAAVCAQSISANRPGFIESTSTLTQGQFQVEFSGSVDDFSPSDRAWSEPRFCDGFWKFAKHHGH